MSKDHSLYPSVIFNFIEILEPKKHYESMGCDRVMATIFRHDVPYPGGDGFALVQAPRLDNIGFTLVFVLFALAHCAALEGPRFTAQVFLISAVVS